MKLEDQVASLELAMRLKEVGVKQESLFYYDSLLFALYSKKELLGKARREGFSAFTSSELGALLPFIIEKRGHTLSLKWFPQMDANNNCHEIGYTGTGEFAGSIYGHMEKARTEADARSKLLIYLIESNLIDPKNTRRE